MKRVGKLYIYQEKMILSTLAILAFISDIGIILPIE